MVKRMASPTHSNESSFEKVRIQDYKCLKQTDVKSVFVGSQLVGVTTTPCNYGGVRYWFKCPRCRGRCGVLYSRHGMTEWRCHKCYQIIYESQEDKAKKLPFMIYYDKACATAGKVMPHFFVTWQELSKRYFLLFPDKPKGMHVRTYIRLMEEYWAYAEAMNEALQGWGNIIQEARIERYMNPNESFSRWSGRTNQQIRKL